VTASVTVAIDTSVVVAAVLPWHQDHERARVAVDEALAGTTVVLPSRTLIESYSVLTRLPSPHRLSPVDANAVLEGTFRDHARIVNLPEHAFWRLLEELCEAEVAGGATFDAEVVAAALDAGATSILTLNRRDFERLVPEAITVLVPPSLK
jgi:predicted nucleic acid-binding protein